MVSRTPDILPYSSAHKREVLSQSQLDILKEGTLQLLQEVGV